MYDLIKMDIIVLVSQLISVLILIYVVMTDMNYVFMKRPSNQLLASIIIVTVLLFIDPLSGFILACCAFVVYYKVFIKMKKSNSAQNKDIKEDNNGGVVITQKQLDDIQTNIFDERAYNKNIDPTLTGYKDKDVGLYSIQGLDAGIPGFEDNTMTRYTI